MHFSQSVDGIGAAGDHVEGLEIEDELSGAGRISFQVSKAAIDAFGGDIPEPSQEITATISVSGELWSESGSITRSGRIESVSRQAIGDSQESYRVEALTEETLLARTRFLWTEDDTAELIEEPEDTKPWNRVPTQDDEERVDLAAVLEKVLDEYLGWSLAGVSEVWASDYVSEYRAVSELCDEIARRTDMEYRAEGGTVEFMDPAEGDVVTVPERYRTTGLKIEEDLSELYNVVRAYGYEYDVLSSESPKIGLRQNVFHSLAFNPRGYLESETLEAWRVQVGEDWEAWDKVYISNVTAEHPVARTLRNLADRMDLQELDEEEGEWPEEHSSEHWIPDPESAAGPGDDASEEIGAEYFQGRYEGGVIELEDPYRVVSGPREVVRPKIRDRSPRFDPKGSDLDGRVVATNYSDDYTGPELVTISPIPVWGRRVEDADVSNIGPLRLEAKIPIRRGNWIERTDSDSISEYGRREAPPLNIDSEAPIDMAEQEAEAYLERHAQPIVRISGGVYAPIKVAEQIEVDGYTAPVRSVAWSISGSILEVNVEAET